MSKISWSVKYSKKCFPSSVGIDIDGDVSDSDGK